MTVKNRISILLAIIVLGGILMLGGCEVKPEAINTPGQNRQVQHAVDPAVKATAEKSANEKEKTNSGSEKPLADTISYPKGFQLPEKIETGNEIQLMVTRDYGASYLGNYSIVSVEKMSVMEILKSNLKVETAYGGGFVSSLEGLKNGGTVGGMRQDWFFYVNGIASNRGADQVSVTGGDRIWWDYHGWKTGVAQTAVIGSYPEPFINGINRGNNQVTIMATPESKIWAEKLAGQLKNNGSQMTVTDIDNNRLVNRNGPIIVIGKWSQLADCSVLKALNDAGARNGCGMQFDEESLKLLDNTGQVKNEVGDGWGVIVASGRGLGDSAPLWLLVGNDEGAVEQIVKILINEPNKTAGRFGVAVGPGGQVLNLPRP